MFRYIIIIIYEVPTLVRILYSVRSPQSVYYTDRMLYLGYALLRYVLIYNLKVSFNFHLTFLQLNVIKMFTVQ